MVNKEGREAALDMPSFVTVRSRDEITAEEPRMLVVMMDLCSWHKGDPNCIAARKQEEALDTTEREKEERMTKPVTDSDRDQFAAKKKFRP